jgi:hypothetical protein
MVVIDRVTKWAGFLNRDMRDVTVLGMAFVGTFTNTIFDLIMVAHIAKRQHVESAFLTNISSGYDTAIAHELYKLIVPGYLILPYFAIPTFEHLLPYWFAVWLVRSRVGVYKRD